MTSPARPFVAVLALVLLAPAARPQAGLENGPEAAPPPGPAGSADPAPPQAREDPLAAAPLSVDEWFLVRVDGEPAGRARTTVTFLADGKVATRQETWLMRAGGGAGPSRLELLVVEDGEGRVLLVDERRRTGTQGSTLHAVIHDGRLVVEAPDGVRHDVPWDARSRGPAFCRRDRSARHADLRPGDRFTVYEFALELGRAVSTRFEVGAQDDALTELIAVNEALTGPPLRLWIDADGGVARAVLTLPAGETVTERVSRDVALAAPVPPPEVTVEHARLQVGSPGLRLAVPPGYRWFDWAGSGLADLVARAASNDGRTLRLAGRLAPPGAPLDLAALRGALGADAVVAVERQAGGRPALIAKDGATGTWGLAVRVGPALLVTRTDRGDDAAMDALRQLADGLRFGP